MKTIIVKFCPATAKVAARVQVSMDGLKSRFYPVSSLEKPKAICAARKYLTDNELNVSTLVESMINETTYAVVSLPLTIVSQ
tara:strand:- start:29894 stop:30139 length:246 start_codon:yes stop_codon:yes gene_type:complete